VSLFVIRDVDELLAVRFACSPVWETLAAVRTLLDGRSRLFHEPWRAEVGRRVAQLDLGPLFAVEPLHGHVPDFITPAPRVPWPTLRDQLAEIRNTPSVEVARDLERCRRTVTDERHRGWVERLQDDPRGAAELLADRIHGAWRTLVAPYWFRIRSLLVQDIEARSRALAAGGLRGALDGLDSRIRWTQRGVSVRNRHRETVSVGERGLVLMPSAFTWPHVAAVVDEPWQPTIVYPARGVSELWTSRPAVPDALGRLLGRTRARVLAALEQPLSTTALADQMQLTPAGASRHLLALRDAGLITGMRHGHEIRYRRTGLGSALLRSRRE
jgi:DNA-binding transcriptional ArsR family regulator